MARFENSKTLVKGFIINLEMQDFKPFEIETSYTRSTEKAQKLAAEALHAQGLAQNKSIVISVTELVNEKAERKNYNNSKIIELAEDWSREEVEGWHKAIMYHVSGYVWLEIADDEFTTEFVEYDTPANLTKVNIRQSIAMHAEDLYEDSKAHAVANCDKFAFSVWCDITPENLEKCEVKKQKED